MKTFVCVVLVGLFLGGILAVYLPSPVSAQPVRTRYQYAYQPPVFHETSNHVRHRNVVEIVSVAQINPAYLSAYAPEGYDAVTQGQILAQIQQLQAQLQQLQTQLKTPPVVAPVVVVPPVKPGDPPVVVPPQAVKPAPVVQPTPGPAIALTILQSHCAACHQAGKLLPAQKFTLLDVKGDLVTLTSDQKLKIGQKTRTAQMPLPSNQYNIPPLTDLEYSAIGDLIGF